jgi:PAS domain S-box-containing protein
VSEKKDGEMAGSGAKQSRVESRPATSDRSGRPYFPEYEAVGRALETSQIGIWTWDIASNRVTWSSNLEAIHGMPPGRFDGSISFIDNDVHPDDRAAVRAALDETLRSHTPYSVQYRPTRADNKEHWLEAVGSVELENGQPARMLGVCRDVTERVRTERELRVRARQQEALARLCERALTATDLQHMLDEAAETIALVLRVEMVKILELVPGDAEMLLRAGVGWKPGRVGTAHVPTAPESQAGYALESGEPVIVQGANDAKRFSESGLLVEHGVVSGISARISGPDGRSYGVLGVHDTKERQFSEYDISFLVSVANVVAGTIQRHQLDQRHELMIRELRHRSGNLFSQLLALFSQSAKTSKNIADLAIKYEARVLALANAHRLITEGGWKSTSLTELLRTLLQPYLDRVTLSGPDVYLEPDPAFGLSTALHELITNAGKHGSLSRDTGRLDMTWTVTRTQRGLTLLLEWNETEGPAPKRTRRPGFGSRLINMVIERQLNGEVRQTFDTKGLHAQLTVPLTHERWPTPVHPQIPATQAFMPPP